MRHFLANLLIIVVLYSNLALIVNLLLGRIAPEVSLPVPGPLTELFFFFDTRAPDESTNVDIEFYGVRPPSRTSPQGELVKLDAADYFPFRRSERLVRSMAVRYMNPQDGAGQRQALATLAAKIRGRYNRLNPQAPLEKIVFLFVQWPRSPEGYEELKHNESLTIYYAD